LARIKCRLISHSNSLHLQQIYTGFYMLHQSGLAALTQVTQAQNFIDSSKPPHLHNSRHAHLSVILNDCIKLHYDTHDSWEIDEEQLIQSDYYFKRSFSPDKLQALGKECKKVHPLGLNYLVYPKGFDAFRLQRDLVLLNRRGIIELIRSFGFIPRVDNMWSPPDFDLEPKVLFMVQAHDPFDDPSRTREKIEERMHINDFRAKCITLLKKEFGQRFHGGFIHTQYAIDKYKGLLLPYKRQSLKRNYMELLRSYPICVATTGLHGSIGWKFAEYVAFSKAIVSERINYDLPGDIRKDQNYLEFVTPEECVEQATTLISNRSLRNHLMTNNAKYYPLYLKSDSLVLNTIKIALSE
jgi:hypothetical protein